MSDEFAFLVSTCGTLDEAEKIARALIERKEAACVNLVTGLTSYFSWKGKLENEKEVLMFIKTSKKRIPDVEKTVKELHSYEVPELIVLDIKEGSKEYLDWIRETTESR